jgi:two-component system, OmpR family, phosphate regulon response regulator PhoB
MLMHVKYILVVEADRSIREMIGFQLRRHGFEVKEMSDAYAAQQSLLERLPDLMLLEWTLPAMNGLDLVRTVRSTESRWLPIMMVTNRSSEEDRVTALDSGVDDIIGKPFSRRELIARVNALLRRQQSSRSSLHHLSTKLVLDHDEQCVIAGKDKIPLPPTDFRLLQFFTAHPERAHTRSDLLESVWGGQSNASRRTVDVQITRLRRVLEPFDLQHSIQTVTGIGYRFSNYTENVGSRFAGRRRRQSAGLARHSPIRCVATQDLDAC